MGNRIKHSGKVSEINIDSITVEVVSSSACAACHAKGVCGSSDTTNKLINVKDVDPKEYSIGENVTLYISEKTAVFVVMLAYIVPVVVIVALLSAFSIWGVEDAIGGVAVLLVIIIYFVILFLFKSKLNRKVSISVTHGLTE